MDRPPVSSALDAPAASAPVRRFVRNQVRTRSPLTRRRDETARKFALRSPSARSRMNFPALDADTALVRVADPG